MALRIHRLIPNFELDEKRIAEWIEREGWVFEKALDPDPQIGRSGDIIWADPDSATALHLIFDEYTKVRYVAIEGERADEFAGRYRRLTDVFYEKQLLLDTPFHAKDREAEILAIYYLAASAPPDFDEDYYEVFNALLGHPDAAVRAEVVAAVAYPDWPELKPRLQELRDEDPDPAVRRAADDFLSYPAST